MDSERIHAQACDGSNCEPEVIDPRVAAMCPCPCHLEEV